MKKAFEKYLFEQQRNEQLTKELSECSIAESQMQETIAVLREEKAAAEENAKKALEDAREISRKAEFVVHSVTVLKKELENKVNADMMA